jgi:tRNA-2-methylthio-N6-dimethylallyladenosine synthase
MERQRDIQKHRNERHLGENVEVMVEGKNDARHQWIGRTSQNKTANFTAPDTANPVIGSYVPVLITSRFPNSLLGELVV